MLFPLLQFAWFCAACTSRGSDGTVGEPIAARNWLVSRSMSLADASAVVASGIATRARLTGRLTRALRSAARAKSHLIAFSERGTRSRRYVRAVTAGSL